MSEPTLLIETSARDGGLVALSAGGRLVERRLDPARRPNRDLAPLAGELLAELGLTPRDIRRVAVGVGPGSFTGLRVGVTSAKVLAYALSCELVPVPTFLILANQCELAVPSIDIVSDGLQGLVYAQRFRRTDANSWEPANELGLHAATEWAAGLPAGGLVGGAGVKLVEALVEQGRVAPGCLAVAAPAFALVAARLPAISRRELFELEPLYLRQSSAEEQAARKAATAAASASG